MQRNTRLAALSIAVAAAVGGIAVPSVAVADTASATSSSWLTIHSQSHYVPDLVTTVTGQATPGSEIRATVDGREVFRTVASEQGNWDGAVGVLGQRGTVTIIVDQRSGDSANQRSLTLQQGPASSRFQALTVSPRSGYLVGATASYDGTATPGALVLGSIDGKDVFKAVAGEDGRWSATTLVPATAQGTVQLLVEQFSEHGQDSRTLTLSQYGN